MITSKAGARILDAMIQKDLNTKDVAKALEMDRKTIYRMIENPYSVRANSLIKVADLLNISLDYIIYGKK